MPIKTRAIAVIFLFMPVWAQAQAPTPEAAPPAESESVAEAGPGPVDAAELEAFVDGVMAAQLKAHDIAGATVSVVRDGRLMFAKGYGWADVADRTAVDADRTLFRIGSVSKLFTWTAVMQLVERGELSLDEDVNRYLADFQIPSTFPEPITLTHLMTHTPGLEDQVIGLFARENDRLRPLGEILAEELPQRVRPPGRLSSYSNHGTGIAGYIVEQVSGRPFDEYVKDNILEPLGMRRTTFTQPLPEELAPDMSHGYVRADGKFEEKEFELVPLAPAGSASATATDMARFMIAHLREGAYDSGRILQEETARRMHGKLFSHADNLPGWLHGFYEQDRNGEKIYGHGGDTFYFHTLLALFPERDLGLFVSYNSQNGPAARSEFLNAFVDRYFPPPDPRTVETRGSLAGAGRLEGDYRSLRYSHSTLAKMAALSGVVRVSREEDLLRTDGLGSEPTRWREIEPLLFEDVDSPTQLVFRQDENGEVTHLFISSFPLAFERVPPLEAPRFQFSVLGGCLFFFLTALVGWPIAAWTGRGKIGKWSKFSARIATLTAWLASGLFVFFMIGLLVALSEPTEIVFGIPDLLRRALWLPLFAIPPAALALAFLIPVWRKSYWGRLGRIHFTLTVLAFPVFLAFLYYWNLLGFRY